MLKKPSAKQTPSVSGNASQKGLTHELAIEPARITIQLVIQTPPPKRGMRRPTIRALGFDPTGPGRVPVQAS